MKYGGTSCQFIYVEEKNFDGHKKTHIPLKFYWKTSNLFDCFLRTEALDRFRLRQGWAY